MSTSNGSYLIIDVIDPLSVCCDAALLICGLRTLGVPLHPTMPFQKTTWEDREGVIHERWMWAVCGQSEDGQMTSDLIKRWKDAEWLLQNPAHEIAVVRTALGNMGSVATEIASAICREVVTLGILSAYIPETASPARRAHLLGKLEGRIPPTEKFIEPEPAAAT